MRYQFIEDHRHDFRVKLMCRVLDVSSSGYYAWRKRPSSPREMANKTLLKEIQAAHLPAKVCMAARASTMK